MLNPSRDRLSLTSLMPQLLPMAPALALCDEAIRRRQIRGSYGRMTDTQLRDIGLTPHEVNVALSLPLDRNATDFLAKAASAEATKW